MKTAADPRHLKRRKIIQELFAWDAQKKSGPTSTKPAGDLASDPQFKSIIENVQTLDNLISQCAPEWEIEKINSIDLAILRLASFELAVEDKEPTKVVIDEAVELAKEFGGDNSPQFINGALAKILWNELRIKKVIAKTLGVDEDQVTPDADLTTDLNATSLEVADLKSRLENELHISIPTDTKIKTVADLLEIIEDQKN